MVKQILYVILIVVSNNVFGQEDSSDDQSVYFELGGSGGLASINYEKQFSKRNYTDFSYSVGLSFAPIDKGNGTGIIAPIMIHAITGKSAHKLDLGLGQGITITTKGNYFFLTTACIGYKFQREKKNWFYRLDYTPLISYLVDFQIQHWAGMTIGYAFNKSTR